VRAIRDAYAEFEQAGAVWCWGLAGQRGLARQVQEEYDLPFSLLADTGHKVAELYGVWGEKKYMGRTYLGVSRSTFVIAEDGTVKSVMHNVKPANHADDVLAVLAG
jgi:peroxiredoxin Q/BCP